MGGSKKGKGDLPKKDQESTSHPAELSTSQAAVDLTAALLRRLKVVEEEQQQ